MEGMVDDVPMLKHFPRFAAHRANVTAVQYSVLVAIIAIVVISAVAAFGARISGPRYHQLDGN
jgi:Flp pilus assembly pilin Flp